MTQARPIILRPCRPGADDAFLFEVFYHSRAEEFAPAGWPEAQLTAFLRSQFQLQHDYYQRVFPQAAYDLIEVGGVAAGRLYVDRTGSDLHIIDICLLPGFRGQGIGGVLMDRLLSEADRDQRAVTLTVEAHNPARRLYQRLGFREGPLEGIYFPMDRPAAVLAGGADA